MEGQVLNLLANLVFTVFGVVFGFWSAGHRAKPARQGTLIRQRWGFDATGQRISTYT
jgi:hypothetical protein